MTAPTPVPYVVTPAMVQVVSPAIDLSGTLYIHMTHYNPITWHNSLSLSNLYSTFPNLIHDPNYGSPIGNPLQLNHTFLLPIYCLQKFDLKLLTRSWLYEVTMG